MKVAFFTDSWLPNIDGVVTSLLNYRGELQRRGHGVWVFTASSRQAIAANHEPRVYSYRALPFPPYPQYRVALFPFPAKSVVRKADIDIVHSHAIASMGLAAIKTAGDLRLPLVGTYHTMIPYGVSLVASKPWSQKLAEKLAWKAIRLFYRPFDLVTAPSEAARKGLEENNVSAPTMVVPNGVDTKRFNPGVDGRPVRKKLGVGGKEKMILVAGRLSHEKHVDVVVRALPHVLKEVDARLVITGRGPADEKVRALVSELGLKSKVTFTGFIPNDNLSGYYAAADVLATASTFETQGLALLEGMACGTPAVGARALAIPEAVEEGKNGFLFEPFDSEGCADKILRVLTAAPKFYDKWSRNARATAEECSIPRSTDKLLKAYERVL